MDPALEVLKNTHNQIHSHYKILPAHLNFRYDRSVDYYKIYYRPASSNVFEDITIQADANETNQRVRVYFDL
jgi:hypothetical protein